jgi:hypothetical protein
MITIKVYLQPRSSKNEIVGPYRDGIKIKVTAPPVEGKANNALIRLLAGELDIPASGIEIATGRRSREKMIRISGVDPQDWVRRLQAISTPSKKTHLQSGDTLP